MSYRDREGQVSVHLRTDDLQVIADGLFSLGLEEQALKFVAALRQYRFHRIDGAWCTKIPEGLHSVGDRVYVRRRDHSVAEVELRELVASRGGWSTFRTGRVRSAGL